jgi:hypothetical protein
MIRLVYAYRAFVAHPEYGDPQALQGSPHGASSARWRAKIAFARLPRRTHPHQVCGERHNRPMDSLAAATRRLRRRVPARKLCVSLAAVWSLLGASVCALAFAISLITAPWPAPEPSKAVLLVLLLALAVLGLCMLPLCTLMAVPLLIAGRRHLRRSLAGTRRVAVWTAIASAGIAIEVLFWLRLIHLLGSSIDFRFLPDYPSWHSLDFSAGFLIVGAATAGVLLSAPSPGSQSEPLGT